MVLLLLVALVAGAGAALSPCVLPVLPALLSVTATGGRRRPLGVVIGLGLTFTISIAVLASAVKGVGLGNSTLRDISIAVVLGFGIVLLIPSLATRLEAPLASLSRLGPTSRGDGFWSGIGVGGALGFVYTPCAGPVLLAVISIGASEHTTLRTLLIGLAYSTGTAIVLLGLALGGRRLLDRARRAFGGPAIQRVLGGVLVLTALAMITKLDINLENWIARSAPNVNLAAALEKTKAVDNRLTHLHAKSRLQAAQDRAQKAQARADAAAKASGAPKPVAKLPVLGSAPDFAGNQRWFNTPGNRALTLRGLRGRVVLVDFWTYTCINCIRTLPYLEAWDRAYRSKGLTIVGVHSPEFTFERDAGNVAHAIASDGIKYPVAQDNNLATWNAYGNQYWPAHYLIDTQGRVRAFHFGEGGYGKAEQEIRELLAERAGGHLGAKAKPHHVITPTHVATPETYLGQPDRATGFPTPPVTGVHDYGGPPANLQPNAFAYSGTWDVAHEAATAVHGARLDANVYAKNTYVVLGTPDGLPRKVHVLLDGHVIRPSQSGADVHHGVLTVSRQRLYSVISLPTDEPHVLSLLPARGVQGYSFTFG